METPASEHRHACVALLDALVQSLRGIVTTVKDLISICRKRVGLTASGMETRKHCTHGEKKQGGGGLLGDRRTMAARFPLGKQPANFPCITLGQDSYQI